MARRAQAHAGVDGAGDGLSGKHIGHAAQQAADAGRQGLQLAVPGLGGQVGGGNALAALHLVAGVDAAEDGQAAAVPAGR